MEIQKCLPSDENEILSLYEAARKLQRERKMVVWPTFHESLVKNELMEGRQWKIVIDNTIACNWVITFNDKEIWGDKDQNNSIFIHRICTHPNFRGNRFIDAIVAWVKTYATNLGKEFIRIDTLGNNTKLIAHYTAAGFKFLGIVQLPDTSNLPIHYQTEPDCCLFEIDLRLP